jgi:hypothetical protein
MYSNVVRINNQRIRTSMADGLYGTTLRLLILIEEKDSIFEGKCLHRKLIRESCVYDPGRKYM